MRILVTNDDGIDAEGLHVLARTLTPLGDVVIVAPDGEYSGSSASIGPIWLSQPTVRRVEIDGVEEAWSISGPPALCVIFGRLGAFGAPFDLVVSGINPGANVGRAVAHSGTIGAVVTGRLGGVSGIAVSQAVDEWAVEGQAVSPVGPQHWQTAADLAAAAAGALLADLPETPVALNINLPNRPAAELAGWRRTEVAAAPIRGMERATLEPVEGEPGVYRGVLGWSEAAELPGDTDGGAVEEGNASITWLSAVAGEAPAVAAAPEAAIDRLLTES